MSFWDVQVRNDLRTRYPYYLYLALVGHRSQKVSADTCHSKESGSQGRCTTNTLRIDMAVYVWKWGRPKAYGCSQLQLESNMNCWMLGVPTSPKLFGLPYPTKRVVLDRKWQGIWSICTPLSHIHMGQTGSVPLLQLPKGSDSSTSPGMMLLVG